MKGRGLWIHVGLLAVSGASALYVWTRDHAATAAVADVTVWGGRPDDVVRIAFESATRKIALESRTDPHGRWFYGTGEGPEPAGPDAGPPSPHTVAFASVSAARKISDALAPFKAARAVGRIDPSRSEEFGFKEPLSTLMVTVGGKEHRLTMGAPTPGGTNRYMRDEGSGNVYAARGDFVRDLESGESALAEHDPHEFDDADVTSLRVTAGGRSREVARSGPPSKRIWADPGSPDKSDETVSNWLAKVERLRAGDYVGEPPAPLEPVVRLDYKVRGASGVYFELAKKPVATGKFDYYVRTEHTRLWAKVYAPWAEQVEQDLASLLK